MTSNESEQSGRVHLTKNDLDFARTREYQRTIRWGIVAATVGSSIAFIAWAVVRIATDGKSPWFAAILTSLVTGLLGSSPTLYWIVKFRGYMKTDHQRVIGFEVDLNHDRESSEIEKDGTSPNDA